MIGGIIMILSSNGLKNQLLANIMMSDLTAYPVKSIFGSMIAETTDLSSAEQKIVNMILKRVQALINKRNEIVHSTWFVGWAHPDAVTFDEAHGHKLARLKSGAGLKGFNFKSEDFDKISAECDLVNALVLRLWMAVIGGDSIAENFVVLESGEVAIPSTNSIRI
jgi:hypothetical protein